MRGFQSTGRHMTAKKYADGGLVQGIKRMVGMDHNYNIEQAAKKMREREAKAAPPPAAPPAAPAITDYTAGGATQRRMNEIDKYADGGPVRGKGTGTSDEVDDMVREGSYIMPTDSTQAMGEKTLAEMGKKVPVKLSNGEFKLAPEQVHAIGVQALDQMKAATHTPVGFAPGAPAQEKEPPMFFANGGLVDEELKRAASMAPTPMAATTAPPPAPKPAVPATQVEGWRTKAVMDGAAEDAQAAWDGGSALGAAGAVARGAITAVPTAIGEFGANTVAPIARGFGAFYEGLTGGTPGQQAAPTPMMSAQAATPPAAAPAPAAAAPSPTAAKPPTTMPPSADAPPQGVEPSARPVNGAPGVYRDGNSYSDSAAGATAGAQSRDAVAPQDMAAADALDARGRAETQALMNRQARGFTVAGPEAGALSSPGMGVIGDPSGREEMRKQLMETLLAKPRGRLSRSETALLTAQRGNILGLLDQDTRQQQALAGNATALTQTQMQQSGAREIAGLREEGDTGRALLRESGETRRAGARNEIDGRRVGLEETVRGFDVRSAQRQEALQQRYAAAKTPAERQAIAQEIRDLNGKTDPANRFTVVPGGQEWDATAGVMRNVPGRVLNNQTGQFVDQAAGGRPLPPMAQNPAAVAIQQNTNLSREEKKAKLRELGYPG